MFNSRIKNHLKSILQSFVLLYSVSDKQDFFLEIVIAFLNSSLSSPVEERHDILTYTLFKS